MSVAVGDIVKGRVTGLAKFGAFVSLEDGKSGLIHISEISNDYVEKVEDYLSKGDEVEVKVIDIGKSGKISLSRKALEKKDHKKQGQPVEFTFERPKADSFEDMMASYLKDANTKMDAIRSRDGKRGTGQRYRQ